MSHLVLDASMALSWLLPDEASKSSVAVQAELSKAEGVWVAAHWRLEVANSLCMAERRKRLDAAGIAQAVALFMQLPLSVDPETPIAPVPKLYPWLVSTRFRFTMRPTLNSRFVEEQRLPHLMRR